MWLLYLVFAVSLCLCVFVIRLLRTAVQLRNRVGKVMQYIAGCQEAYRTPPTRIFEGYPMAPGDDVTYFLLTF